MKRDQIIGLQELNLSDIASNSENFIIPCVLTFEIFEIISIIFILSISIFIHFIKIRNNISIDTKIHWYLILPILVPLIYIDYNINTPRKFALIIYCIILLHLLFQ